MNRRDFLLFRNESANTAELSCEQLYMRYLDSTLDGTTDEFFTNLEQCLAEVTVLHLNESAWLNCEELEPLKTIFTRFRERGGRFAEGTPRRRL